MVKYHPLSVRKMIIGFAKIDYARIAVDDVIAYNIDPSGYLELTPTRHQLLECVTHSKPNTTSGYSNNLRRKLKKELCSGNKDTVVVMPDLVLYVSKYDAYFSFSHFTPKYAVFKFLKKG